MLFFLLYFAEKKTNKILQSIKLIVLLEMEVFQNDTVSKQKITSPNIKKKLKLFVFTKINCFDLKSKHQHKNHSNGINSKLLYCPEKTCSHYCYFKSHFTSLIHNYAKFLYHFMSCLCVLGFLFILFN